LTRLLIITGDDPYSIAAFDAVRQARETLDPFATGIGSGAQALVGGPTAELADTQTALNADFLRVAVITVLGVLVVLILLLRAIVAPVYLVLTVLLSYLCTIGLTSWFYQAVLGQPGVNFFLPLMVFVLLVALGSDYNIFLMSRVREESEHRPIRDGIRVASGRTGAVITSAGLILAGTFGSMASAPLIVLFQIGVAVAVGVLIDTFVVRSILVPAVTTLAGERAWWPSRQRHEPATPAPSAPRAGHVAVK
jgi:RND superfamily putative drug exporter